MVPNSAPDCHTVVRKARTLRVTRAHKSGVFGLEHHPAGALLQRLAEEREEPAHVDVDEVLLRRLPLVGQRARAPNLTVLPKGRIALMPTGFRPSCSSC